MSADAQWEAIRIVLDAGGKATSFEHDLAHERLEMFRERQQRQDEEIERLRRWQKAYSEGRKGLVEMADEDRSAADAVEARVQQLEDALRESEGMLYNRTERAKQLEDALREAADRFSAIAQGKTADMHEAVAARAEQAARAVLGEKRDFASEERARLERTHGP